MGTLLVLALLAGGGFILLGDKEAKPGPDVGLGEVWSLGFKSPRPFSDADWRAFMGMIADYGDVMGVTEHPSGTGYVVTVRYKQALKLPPIGKTVQGVKFLFAQKAPVMAAPAAG